MSYEKCTPSEDKDFAGIVLWLLCVDQEAHVALDGSINTNRSRHADRRRKRRQAAEALALADAKRLKKMQKRLRL